MKRCPVCRAKVKEKSVCRRCRADLTDLITLEHQADYMMTMAVRYLRDGNIQQARRFCNHAVHLQSTEFGEIFRAFLKAIPISGK